MRQVCIFRVDDILMCLPIEQVQQVVEHVTITPIPLAPRSVLGLLNLRGLVVTAIDLRVVLALPDAPGLSGRNIVALVDDRPLSLSVDEILSVDEVNEDDLLPLPPTLSGPRAVISTGVLRQEERLILMVDSSRLALAARRAA